VSDRAHGSPHGRSGAAEPLVSVVTAAYGEAENLPVLHERLAAVLDGAGLAWEWVVVDDHSADGTFAWIARAAAADPRVRGVRLSRNVGSHAARACGLEEARGRCVVGLAADLQDPPELVPELVARWRSGAQVVLAQRRRRRGESLSTRALSRAYHGLLRSLGAPPDAAAAAGYWLLDRVAVDAIRSFPESHLPLNLAVASVGFRREEVAYDAPPRLHGRSRWTLEKKIRLALDSFTAVGDRPLRWLAAAGGVATVGAALVLFALAVAALRDAAVPAPAWIAAAVIGLAGFQALLAGVLGQYVWLALEEARRRPRYLVEDRVGTAGPGAGPGARP
jgi:dolichol-phosphate mannosyltransferase